MAASSNHDAPHVSCADFLAFQDTLKKLRIIDDRITNALNSTVPTQSFADKVDVSGNCKKLFEEMSHNYNQRDTAIKSCIRQIQTSIYGLKSQKESDPDNYELMKQIRKEQTKLRLMQSELSVEEVLRDRSYKVFHERCRAVYSPPQAPIL